MNDHHPNCPALFCQYTRPVSGTRVRFCNKPLDNHHPPDNFTHKAIPGSCTCGQGAQDELERFRDWQRRAKDKLNEAANVLDRNHEGLCGEICELIAEAEVGDG